MTFIEYLKDWHFTNYPEILDDELDEHFENWLDNLGARECALMAEAWQMSLVIDEILEEDGD